MSALTKTLALVGGTIHEYLGGNNIAKGQEHLHQLIVSKLLREMVDEEIAAFRTCRHGGKGEEQNREPPKGRGRERGSTQSTALDENPSTASFCLDLPLLVSLSHWSRKGSEGSLKSSWEATCRARVSGEQIHFHSLPSSHVGCWTQLLL